MDFCQPELEVFRVESSDMDYDVNFYGSLIERCDSHSSSVSLSDNSNSREESSEESVAPDKIVSTQISY